MSLAGRARTIAALVAHFAKSGKLFFLPLLLVLLLGALLLAITGGLSYVAPFIYTLW